jgi:hypothetical protein
VCLSKFPHSFTEHIAEKDLTTIWELKEEKSSILISSAKKGELFTAMSNAKSEYNKLTTEFDSSFDEKLI